MAETMRTKDPHSKAAKACGCLIGTALVLVAFGRHDRVPPVIDPADVARTVELFFADQPDGSVVARNAATGDEIERIAPGQGGFIRVTMRSFAGERKQRGLTGAEPFTLLRLNDGDLLLQDRTTGRSMLLNAFGPSNEGVFAELIDNERMTR